MISIGTAVGMRGSCRPGFDQQLAAERLGGSLALPNPFQRS